MPLSFVPGPRRILAVSAIAASLTGSTAEAALATITIPAGVMGLNGILSVRTAWTVTSNANVKTLRIRFGGLSGVNVGSVLSASTAVAQVDTEIMNRGSASSQYAAPKACRNDALITAIPGITAAVNTAAAVDLVLSAQLANAADTATLEYYCVELVSA